MGSSLRARGPLPQGYHSSIAADDLGFADPAHEDGPRAAGSGANGDRRGFAIFGAGSTLHAKIPVRQLGLASVEDKHPARADIHAHSAARAARRIIAKGDDIAEITVFHLQVSLTHP